MFGSQYLLFLLGITAKNPFISDAVPLFATTSASQAARGVNNGYFVITLRDPRR